LSFFPICALLFLFIFRFYRSVFPPLCQLCFVLGSILLGDVSLIFLGVKSLCACVCGMILLASGHLTSNPVLQSYVRVSGYGRVLVLGRECSSLSVSRMPMPMLCISDIFSCFQRLKIAKSRKTIIEVKLTLSFLSILLDTCIVVWSWTRDLACNLELLSLREKLKEMTNVLWPDVLLYYR